MKTLENCESRTSGREGFSRQELVAVLAIAFLVITIQLPLLGRSHDGDLAATCRNNLRQLAQAWLQFADDNRGQLPPNNGSSPSASRQSWVAGWLDFTASLDNINTDYLIGFEKSGSYYGHLGPYLKSASVFKCPADVSQVTIFGVRQSRSRSVSMNSWMGGYAYAGETGFRVFQKESDIIGLPPSMAWVIQDERADSINDSWFAVDMNEVLVNYPGSYHNGGSYLSFADGHVDFHQWQDKRTNPDLVAGNLLPLGAASPNNPDLEWLQARTTIAQ